MKRIFNSCLLLLTVINTLAQDQVPAEIVAFFKKAIPAIHTKHSNWIKKTFIEISEKEFNKVDINSLVARYGKVNGLQDLQVEGINLLLLAGTSLHVYEDIYKLMKDMEERRKRKLAVDNALKTINERYQKEAAQAREMPRYEFETLDRLNSDIPITANNPNVSKDKPELKVTDAEIQKLVKDLRTTADILKKQADKDNIRLQNEKIKYTRLLDWVSELARKLKDKEELIIAGLK